MARIPRIPFHFRAQAHAFSGEIHHPFWYPIKAKASTSLPTIGGLATAKHEGFHCHGLVSFRKAHSTVSGRKVGEEVYMTHATTTIEHLNIENVLTAERIVCQLTSQYDSAHPEGLIVANGSKFENLQIQKERVDVFLRHGILEKCENFKQAQAIAAADKADQKVGRLAGANEHVALFTLVERIETKLPYIPKDGGYIFEVPNFGRVTIAEVFAEPAARTLTMLHLELGSPQIANLTVAEGGTNGKPPPPTS
jgi:hypothetical protein